MVVFNIGDFPKFSAKVQLVILENAANNRFSITHKSADAIKFFKEEFDLDVVILPHSVMGAMMMEEKDFIIFKLRWA